MVATRLYDTHARNGGEAVKRGGLRVQVDPRNIYNIHFHYSHQLTRVRVLGKTFSTFFGFFLGFVFPFFISFSFTFTSFHRDMKHMFNHINVTTCHVAHGHHS